MKILFLSRAYPPIIGGIENQNYALSVYLQEHASVKTIANRHGRIFLPIFLPFTLVRALFTVQKYDVVLLGDGVLSVVGYFLKKFSSVPVVSILHGLDINYNSRSLNIWYEKLLITCYQNLWVKKFLPSLDGFIVISEETKKVALAAHLPEEKITVIPNGVRIPEETLSYNRKELEKLLDRDLSETAVLLTAGRLAKRKGVAWFIRHVLPQLPGNILYVVAGAGPDQKNIEAAIRETGEEKRVVLLGRVTDEVRDLLFSTADIFLQPNIQVPGDMEGFGLTVIEATVAGLPVVASRLEGLQEAIRHEENGLLVAPEDKNGYLNTVQSLLQSEERRKVLGQKAREYAKVHYDWRIIAQRYADTLEPLTKKHHGRSH